MMPGNMFPVTVLRMENCQVVAQRTQEKNGYTAVQLGVGLAKVKNTSKAMRGHFATASVEPKAKVAEFRVSADNMIDVGAEITVEHFVAGQKVDVTGTTIGKGFQGVIKRHHMGGGRATHGNSVSHRTHGSTGQRQDPGKVFKGKHMAGHMGDTRVTTQNVEMVSTDADRGLILIRGAVPDRRAHGSWSAMRPRWRCRPMRRSLPRSAPLRRTKLRPQRERNNGHQDHNAWRQGRRQGEALRRDFRP